MVRASYAQTGNSYDAGEYEVTSRGKKARFTVDEDNLIVEFYIDENGDGVRQADEPLAEEQGIEVKVEKVGNLGNYNFNIGWNLIGVRGFSEDWDTARELLYELNEQGVEVTHVAAYDEGTWQMFSRRTNDEGIFFEYGEDYNLLPGRGYFIKSLNSADASLSGNKFLESVPIDLANGWNLISVQAPDSDYTAESFIDFCVNNGITCDTVSRYDSGLYDSVVKTDGVMYGNDFNVVSLRGYFVRVKDGGGKRLTP